MEIGHSERRHVFREDDLTRKKDGKGSPVRFHSPAVYRRDPDSEGIRSKRRDPEHPVKGGTSFYHRRTGKASLDCLRTRMGHRVNGIPADSGYVAERHAGIRRILCARFGEEQGSRIPILYGGSVNPQNAQELIALPDVDGLFIGRSAWDASQFNRIIRQVMPLYMNK